MVVRRAQQCICMCTSICTYVNVQVYLYVYMHIKKKKKKKKIKSSLKATNWTISIFALDWYTFATLKISSGIAATKIITSFDDAQ